ncbi:hypothetical protein RJ498_002190 [Pluralibacter gergoviae]
MNRQYNNELTQKVLATMGQSPLTSKQLVGSQYTYDGKSIALVSSLLDDGDEIISIPQGGSMLTRREGVPMPADFLTMSGA